MGYIPRFKKGTNDVLLLDNSFYEECIEYADAHNMDVLYTGTTSTSSVETIMEFQKLGYRHELYEVPRSAPDGLVLKPKVYCRLTRHPK